MRGIRRASVSDVKRCGASDRFPGRIGRSLKNPFRVGPPDERRRESMTRPSSLLAMMALIGLAMVELLTHLLPWA